MDTEEKYLERLEILVEEEDFALAEALVGQALSYGWEEESLATGQIKLTLHCEDGELLNALAVQIRNFLPEAQCLRSKIVQADWTNAWKEYFTPIEAGDFVILPPWLAKSYENPQKALSYHHRAEISLRNRASCQHRFVFESHNRFVS